MSTSSQPSEGVSTTSPPYVLVVTPVPALRQTFTAALLRERPHWQVQPIEPEALEARLLQDPAPVVLCTEPTIPIQRYARAWAVLAPSGADLAYVGRQDGWLVVKPLTMAGVADALDELLSQPTGHPIDQPLLPLPEPSDQLAG